MVKKAKGREIIIIIVIIIESIPRKTINIQDLRTRVNVDTSAILSSQEGEYKSL